MKPSCEYGALEEMHWKGATHHQQTADKHGDVHDRYYTLYQVLQQILHITLYHFIHTKFNYINKTMLSYLHSY